MSSNSAAGAFWDVIQILSNVGIFRYLFSVRELKPLPIKAHSSIICTIQYYLTSKEDLHERLSGVVIECLPYAEFITRYDKPETLFYLDPPYWDCEKDYGKGVFARSDFEALAKQLKKFKGRFIMSINDVPEIRKLFKWACIEAVETTYTIGTGNGKKVGELIISNQ